MTTLSLIREGRIGLGGELVTFWSVDKSLKAN